ncbi:uncharacterized protein LOC129290708 isoform X2 [Prosopis cineraria]|uniref:uncharacterized protein LOC129290708 isoform X2 n=1 Tax=Prosopis cineraria TaxID=364024 RepID=UPI00240ED13F|nr:uncharacterized protein LOC129290708 isoform X2 [Prosopis cineraria]
MELNKPEILFVANPRRAPEFGHEGIAHRREPAAPDSLRKHEVRFGFHGENGQVRYEDLTNILGSKRLDSENPFEIADLNFTREPTQEMENGAFVDKNSKSQKEDGNVTQGARKTLGESVGDQADTGAPGSPFLRKESSYSNEVSGLGASDDSQSGKIKLLCSFGGKVLPRPRDGKLRYVGGETRIISIRKDISWQGLLKKTLGICIQPHSIKYQLPGEDLDSLISVSSDEDLQNMIEEYHGPERHKGSQRLRIFLIPLSESEKELSFESRTDQQSNPDYQYVVAVNGIGDCSPRINSLGQILTNEVGPPGTDLNFAPDFQKIFPNAPSSEIKGGGIAIYPNGFFNDSQNLQRTSNQHQQISSTPFQGGNLSTILTQSRGNNSCQESATSSSSFITAQLSPETSNVSAADSRYSPQMAATFLSDNQPCQQTDIGLPEQYCGKLFRNNPGKEFMTALFANQSDSCNDEILGEGSMHKSGNPLSSLGESVSPQSGSNCIPDSLNGIPHAFSDSKLHESGFKSGYCSQEGIGQFSSLNLSMAQLSSMVPSSVSQRDPMEIQHDPLLVYPQIQSKMPIVEPGESHGRQDFPISLPSTVCLGVNDPIQKDSILYSKRNPLAQTDLTASIFMERQCGDNTVNIEIMKRMEDENSLQSKDSNLYERESPAIAMEHVNELHLLDSSPTSNLNTKIHKQNQLEQSSEGMVSASFCLTGISQNNLIEMTPSDFLAMSHRTNDGRECGFTEGLNGELGFDFSWTRKSGFNASSLKCEGNSSGNTSQSNHLFELPMDLVSHKQAQVQPLRKDTDLYGNPTVSSGFLYSSALHDDPGPSSNLPVNELQNSSKNIVFKRVSSLIDDDLIASSSQMVDQYSCGTLACETRVEDIMLEQSKIFEKSDNSNKIEPLITIEDVTNVVPPSIESSLAPIQHIVVEIGSDVLSPSAADLESTIPDSELEDFKDEEGKNESLTDARVAEMEASIYGLQIIRNADLEELRELGSGTYGTVYHGKWRGTDVAIKRIKKSCFLGRSSEQERLTKDFWREAQILSNLHHPNVVAFYGVVPDGAGGTLATVTEYMVNGSLRHVLVKKDRLLDRHRKLIIAMDAAFGMEYLHSKNIVHFDLKCDNLLVNLRDPLRPICKVGDFGLSRIKRNTLVSGGVRGTLPWIAPELLNGSSNQVSEKVDVFSFGISMWEILTGEEPYADMHCGAIIGGIVKNTLRPPIPPHCDPEWRKLMEECWSPDPDSRPSFTEITSRLRSMSMALQAKPHNQVR